MDGSKVLKITSVVSLIIAMSLVILVTNVHKPTKVDDRLSISFEDSLVCQKVASDLNSECSNNTVKLSQDSIDSYKVFTIRDDITSLVGLENFKNLTELKIYNAPNLSIFDSLASLNIKSIALDSISDITLINSLVTLESVDLSNAPISDVNAINLPNLGRLVLNNTNVTDVNSLNNGKIRIYKDGLVFDTSSLQTIDDLLYNLDYSYNEYEVTGPCIIDYNYRLNYNKNAVSNSVCSVRTPDNFVTLTYNLIFQN